MVSKFQILIILSFLTIILSLETNASSSIPSLLNFHIGSIATNYIENPDKLEATDNSAGAAEVTPYSGTSSSMPFVISYEYFPGLSKSYFARVAGPIMGTTPDRYYSGSVGINFYFGQIASKTVIKDTNFELLVLPKFRYYAGPSIGMGYLVYNTKSAIKNDILFEIGGQAGILYSLNPKWAISAEAGGARGIGSLTSATIVKILIGTSYTLDIWGSK